MYAIEIIKNYLDDNGYDGLVNLNCPCGCDKNDLSPGDECLCEDCQPAYKHINPNCTDCDSGCDPAIECFKLKKQSEEP